MKIFTFILATAFSISAFSQTVEESKPPVDYTGFVTISNELQDYREGRLIEIERFNKYALEPNTLILDTRSRAAYEDIHIKGAVHLNFSDFNKKTLEEIIPNKDYRILIYCNNNFVSNEMALYAKTNFLALNIPTFINLFGYGYENIYELGSYLEENDARVDFVKN